MVESIEGLIEHVADRFDNQYAKQIVREAIKEYVRDLVLSEPPQVQASLFDEPQQGALTN